MEMCRRCREFYQKFPLREVEGAWGKGQYHVLDDGILMSPIKCAFETGRFSSDNWNCQTMIALRTIAESLRYGEKHPLAVAYERDDMSSASIGVVRIPEASEEEIQQGYIVMTWYKNRGHTGRAIVVWDDFEPEPLTLRTAEWVLEQAEKGD